MYGQHGRFGSFSNYALINCTYLLQKQQDGDIDKEKLLATVEDLTKQLEKERKQSENTKVNDHTMQSSVLVIVLNSGRHQHM